RPATLPALADASPRVRRAGLLALDQMRDGNLTRDQVVPLLDSDDTDLQQTALAVIGRRPGWSDAAAGGPGRWLASPRLSGPQERALTDVLLASGLAPALQQVVADALASPRTATATRLLLLGVVARCPVQPLPAGWVDGLRTALAAAEAPVR